jgi:hypothetical protein
MVQVPLRVVLVPPDPDAPPGWITRLAKRIQDSSEIEICAVAASAPAARRRGRQGSFLFRWVRRLELRFGALLTPVQGDVSNESWGDIARIAGDDEKALETIRPDVILDLSGNHGHGLPAEAAQHGIWFTDSTDPAPGLAG